ncbi:hypothetical protein EGR_09754 [Echinococcus granulosus]|uniref:Uncharacterized protein n=1 Tax=Echinococcus granulosus TaxID=6210 RepID=W6UA76_ECHGR|nr:hypothetical protein EGR_09754 [Echinococcus granulosus]EUB55377.1 hypothetical protein EGR_09754 [Echinococcus granulosus]
MQFRRKGPVVVGDFVLHSIHVFMPMVKPPTLCGIGKLAYTHILKNTARKPFKESRHLSRKKSLIGLDASLNFRSKWFINCWGKNDFAALSTGRAFHNYDCRANTQTHMYIYFKKLCIWLQLYAYEKPNPLKIKLHNKKADIHARKNGNIRK